MTDCLCSTRTKFFKPSFHAYLVVFVFVEHKVAAVASRRWR
jgi:hypothetical protein